MTTPQTESLLRQALEEFDNKLQQWAAAYPLTVFPEPDLKRAHEALTAAGMTLDGISASNMRHVVTKLNEDFEAIRSHLSKGEAEPSAMGDEIATLVERLTFLSANDPHASVVTRETFSRAAALLSSQQAVPVPTGWKLVPIEPTGEMLCASANTEGMQAVNNILVCHQLRSAANAISQWPGIGSPVEQSYRAMLEAAPPPPSPPTKD